MNVKVQRDWAIVRNELNAKLQQSGRNFRLLAESAGVSYHAARRFILNGATNRTATAERLCKYFHIPIAETANLQNPRLEELTALVGEVWDGSGPHAELLARLIKSTKSFRVQNRQNSG